jgi:hypothetical protein
MQKSIKAARSAGKAKDTNATLTFAGKSIPGTEKVIDPLAKGLGKVGNVIREDLGPISNTLDKLKHVSTKFRPKGVDPVEWQKYTTASEKARNIRRSTEFTAIEKAKEIYKSFKAEGLDDKAISEITNAVETKGATTSKGGLIAKEARDEFQSLYKNVGKTGKSIIQDENVDFLPHVNVRKSTKIKHATGLGARDFTTKSPSDIRRTILKYTDESGEDFVVSTKTGHLFKDGKKAKQLKKEEIKSLLKNNKFSQASIKEINKAYGEPVFSTKLPDLIAIQGVRTAKVIGGDELFKNVSKFGSKGPRSLKGVDYVESTAPDLAGKFFHPEIAKHVDATYQKLVNPEEINEIVKTYDTVQNLWKTSATYWNVAFHTRNSISNLWQNSLARVNNPADYAKAGKIQFGLRKGIDNLLPDEKQIINEYQKQGLSKVGHLSGDIGQSIETEIHSAMDLLKSRKPGQALNKVGGAAGDMVEGNAKLAHFIAKRKEGLSPFDAGHSVKKYLFDYEDLTRLEKEGFKRLFPFYTFTRKNMPLQLETLVKNPSRQSKLIKAKNNVEILTGDDKTNAILPEWIKESAPVFVGRKDGKVRYVKMEGFLPVADLNRLSDPTKGMLNMLSPVLKSPLEQAANYNFYFGQKITKQKGIDGFAGYGERDLLWSRIPARLEHLARLFRPISELEKIIGKKYKNKNALEKAANLVLGGKVYEYETRALLNKFDRLSDEEATNMKSQINFLKKEIRRDPSLRDQNITEIKRMFGLYNKAKQESRINKKRAREQVK